MTTFAVIQNGIVTNIIVANTEEDAQGAGEMVVPFDYDHAAHIGLGYQDGVFEQPAN